MWFYRPSLRRILKVESGSPRSIAKSKHPSITQPGPTPTDKIAGGISEDEEEVAKVMEYLLMAVVDGDAAAALKRDLESDANPSKQACVEGTVSAHDRQMGRLLSCHAKMFAEYKHTSGGSAPLDTYVERLRLFFHHTSNGHVSGWVGSGIHKKGLALHANHDAAQAACKDAAGIDDEEFNRLFCSVDRVHAYT